jgi:hypothetical protein
LKSVESIRKYWPEIPKDKKLEIRYEQFTNEGMKTLTEVLEFLRCNTYDQFFTSIPKLKKNNFNKWKTEFSRHQLQEIHPILTPMLIELGYESSHNWLPGMAQAQRNRSC